MPLTLRVYWPPSPGPPSAVTTPHRPDLRFARSTKATRPIHHTRSAAVGRVASSAISRVTVRVRALTAARWWSRRGPRASQLMPIPPSLVHYGGRSNRMRRVCLPVEIQGTIRTTLLDTGSEVSLLPTEFHRPGTELQTGDFPVWAAHNSRLLVEGRCAFQPALGSAPSLSTSW